MESASSTSINTYNNWENPAGTIFKISIVEIRVVKRQHAIRMLRVRVSIDRAIVRLSGASMSANQNRVVKLNCSAIARD